MGPGVVVGQRRVGVMWVGYAGAGVRARARGAQPPAQPSGLHRMLCVDGRVTGASESQRASHMHPPFPARR